MSSEKANRPARGAVFFGAKPRLTERWQRGEYGGSLTPYLPCSSPILTDLASVNAFSLALKHLPASCSIEGRFDRIALKGADSLLVVRQPDFQAQRGLGRAGLELEFQRQLQLPSRAEVPGWKARGGDPSERGALDIQIGVPEVGMIEHVERFGAELQAHALVELCVLDQGQIAVDEVGSREHIAAKIAEVATARNDGISTRGSWHIAESAWNTKRGTRR